MITNRTTYVALYSPTNEVMSDVKQFEVDTRDPYEVETPEDVFAMLFYDMVEAEEEGIELNSGAVNVSPLYYVRGELLDVLQIEQKYPDDVAAIDNFNLHDISQAIKFGSYYTPFNPEDHKYLDDYEQRIKSGNNAGDLRTVREGAD